MMAGPILIAFGSRYGSTLEVAESIAATLRRHELPADVRAAADVDDLGEYGGVVLGGGIYMGRWHKDARSFAKRFADELADVPVALFALGPTDNEASHWVDAERQFQAAVAKLPVRAVSTKLFGGAVDPRKLSFPFNRIPAADARDWDAVHAWAEELAVRFEPALVVC